MVTKSRTEEFAQKNGIDAPAVRRYLRTLKPEDTSYLEKISLSEIEPTSEYEDSICLLIGSLRRDFFDGEHSEFLNILAIGSTGSIYESATQLIIAEHIYREIREQGAAGYWLSAVGEYHGDTDGAMYDLLALYGSYFQDHHDLLRYLLRKEDPLRLVEALASVSASRLKEVVEQLSLEPLSFGRSMESAVLSFTNALCLAESSEGTPEGFLDLPYEVILRFLDPVEPQENDKLCRGR